jgi:DNA-binding response OmpR family regulator
VRVLVVGADNFAAHSLVTCLERHGHATDIARSGQEALRCHPDADFVLLDLELPDVDGVKVCRSIRAASDTPIIALAPPGNELDRVLGLQAGADDCLAKDELVSSPHAVRELLARIEAIMRRANSQRSVSGVISRGPLHINMNRREVRLHDSIIEFTRKEFNLLSILASREGDVVTRKEIMSKVWGYRWTTSSRTIDMHVSSLRSKLGSPSWIVTIRGVGFRIGEEEPALAH